MSLLAIKGIYENGQITLDEKISSKKPITVIVTFLEDNQPEPTAEIFSSFNFEKAQTLSAQLQTSLTDALIDERRESQ
jgi:hypothetical protein